MLGVPLAVRRVPRQTWAFCRDERVEPVEHLPEAGPRVERQRPAGAAEGRAQCREGPGAPEAPPSGRDGPGRAFTVGQREPDRGAGSRVLERDHRDAATGVERFNEAREPRSEASGAVKQED